MEPNRVLFVDDEPGLRLTFPEILRLRGFEVQVAATVAEALSKITTYPFDILISDLNIGQPGDGFTVVSAMRRTQPDCINFIVTGFPAFENALAALQNQVDDYLVKPASIEQLVSSIQLKLKERQPHCPAPLMRLSTLLRGHVGEICDTALSMMRSDPEIALIPMSDEQRIGHLPGFVVEIANQLEALEPAELTDFALRSGVAHGVQRCAFGYEISMLVTDATILDAIVYDIVRSHLILLDTSNLVLDLKRFNQILQLKLKQSIRAFSKHASGDSVGSGVSANPPES